MTDAALVVIHILIYHESNYILIIITSVYHYVDKVRISSDKVASYGGAGNQAQVGCCSLFLTHITTG